MPKPKVISNNPEMDISPISPYGAVQYYVDSEALKELVKQSAGIKTIGSAKDVAAVMPFIAALRVVRLAVDKERRTQKEGALQYGRLVDSEAKALIEIIQPEEERLQAIRKTFEDIAAAVKREKLEAEAARKAKHTDRIQAISDMPGNLISNDAGTEELNESILTLKNIDTKEFEEFQGQAEGAISTALSVLGGMLALAFQTANQARIDAGNAAKAKELQKAQDKITEEREANEREANRLETLKREHAEAEKRAEAFATQKLIDDEAAAKQKIIDDKEAKKVAAAEKKEAAKAEKLRLENIKLCEPDAEILSLFAGSLREIAIPALTTNQDVSIWIEEDIEALAQRIVDTANKMIS